jgi:Collagen triple helix repeat (20 copies)
MALAIGDFSEDGEEIITGFTAKDGAIYRFATQVEKWAEQIRRNGYRVLGAHNGRQWEGAAFDGIFDLDLGTDAIVKGMTLPENILYDASPVQAWEGQLAVNQTTIEDDGSISYQGVDSERVNVKAFRISRTAYDATGTPLADNPWVGVQFESPGDPNDSFVVQFRMNGDGFLFAPSDGVFLPKTHVRGRYPAAQVPADLTVAGNGRFVRRMEVRPSAQDLDMYICEIWHYVGNANTRCTFTLAPLDLAENLRPTAVSDPITGAFIFLESPELVGFRFVSQILTGKSDVIISNAAADIASLRGSVVDIRTAQLRVEATANQAKVDLAALNGVAGGIVSPGDATFIAGVWYENKTEAAIFLPTPVAVVAGLTAVAGGVSVGNGVLAAATDATFTGRAAAGITLGINNVTGKNFYVNADGNWTEDIDDIPAAVATNIADIAAMAKASKAKLDAVKTNALDMDEPAVKALIDLGIGPLKSSAVASYDPAKTYVKDDFCTAEGKQYLLVSSSAKGISPIKNGGVDWIVYTPSSDLHRFEARGPTGNDIEPLGVVWSDTRYSEGAVGSNVNINYLSKGGGLWESLNSITLRKIVVRYSGVATSWTEFRAIRILKADLTEYGNIWRAGDSLNAAAFPGSGQMYTGQACHPPTGSNSAPSSAMLELLPSVTEGLAGFGGFTANYRVNVASTRINTVEVHYNNGHVRISNHGVALANANTRLTLTEPRQFPIGSNIAAASGVELSPEQAGSETDKTFGRISGELLGIARKRNAVQEIGTVYGDGVTPQIEACDTTGRTFNPALTGSLAVNQGQVHTVMATPAFENQVAGSHAFFWKLPESVRGRETEIRWGLRNAASATACQIRNYLSGEVPEHSCAIAWNGTAWVVGATDIPVTSTVDGGWTWFSRVMRSRPADTEYIVISVPPGDTQIPALYEVGAQPAQGQPVGLMLHDTVTDVRFPYAPGNLVSRDDLSEEARQRAAAITSLAASITAAPPGAKGDTGAAGAKGADGAPGPKGDTGVSGVQGIKGDTGAAGAKGDAGVAGPQGIAGAGPAPNLTALNLGTFLTADGAPIALIRDRQGARIKSFDFTFRDRRTTAWPTRTGAFSLLASEMAGGGGWAARIDGWRPGVSRDLNVVGVTYPVYIQWVVSPSGVHLWLQDAHAGTWNAYGEFVNFTVTWEAS